MNNTGSPPKDQGNPPQKTDASREWRNGLTGCTLGLLAFETVSGLAIYWLPFSVFQQFEVLAHTVLGLAMIVPVGWYLVRHWKKRITGNFSHYMLLGILSMLSLVLLYVTGIVLSGQALLGTRIAHLWDMTHIVAGFVMIFLLGAHLVTLLTTKLNIAELRSSRLRCLVMTCLWASAPFVVCWAFMQLYTPPDWVSSFPDHYNFKYGRDRPFAPSLVRKEMSKVEDDMKAQISSVLTARHQKVLLDSLKPDPNEHEGIVSAAERLCSQMQLNPDQQSQIHSILESTRNRYKAEGRIDPMRLAGSKNCGTAGCHQQILAEWQPSAHRYAAMDVVFQRVQEIMVQEKTPEATRYCAGCHDPISLLSGAKNDRNVTLSAHGADEGISCIVCHSIVKTDVRGNADYSIKPPDSYLFEHHEGVWAKRISDFLIRAYPQKHIASYSKPLYKTTEYCAACHKQFIDEEVNDFGWVQGQNQYDSWRKSRWHNKENTGKTVSCRECHMPLILSTDPASGDMSDPGRSPADGKHRSHRHLGANQFIPTYHKLEGADQQVEQIVHWLQGKVDIPEIADKWTKGPVVRLGINAPAKVHPGQTIPIQVLLTNNKAGHNFPTGPLDMIESWLELTVTDESGEIIYSRGTLDDKGYLENPGIVLKKELIDRDGNLIDRHNLWDAVGARYKRSLFPGSTDATDYTLRCPGMGDPHETPSRIVGDGDNLFTVGVPKKADLGQLTIKATLWYSKFKASFMDRVFEEQHVRASATAINSVSKTIQIVTP